jgi:hypothetical protein
MESMTFLAKIILVGSMAKIFIMRLNAKLQ